jgi:hypothetical protein
MRGMSAVRRIDIGMAISLGLIALSIWLSVL